MIPVDFVLLPHAEDLPRPTYATGGSAGLDLRAATKTSIDLQAGERTLIPTGIAMAIPSGFEAQVRPRSGLAFKHGISVLNTPGTIDSDYRGEIGVILINHGDQAFQIERGDRIAQLVIQQLPQIELVRQTKLSETQRADSGFGSTGL